MTSVATVKFKEHMVYEKFSEATTIFEEAFSILVLENNFHCWVYLAKKNLNKQKEDIQEEEIDNEDSNGGQINRSISEDSSDSNKSNEIVPDVVYQKKIKQRKDKRETAGKWTMEGMKRLNLLIEMVQQDRNSENREKFEEELQDMYINYADKNMERVAANKRKREVKEMNQAEKKVVVENVLDLVAL